MGVDLHLTKEQVNAYNEVLLDYGIYVLSETKPLKLDTSMLSSNDKNSLSTTPAACNTCVNPLEAVRAWALLSLVAVGKTTKASQKFLHNVMGNLISSDESVHDVLRALHNLMSVKHPKQCVRLFVEHQPAVPIVTNVVQKINAYYSTNKSRPAFVQAGFTGDDDGLASIARINAEVNDSTEGRVNFVVREDNGPNRRTQMVLVSASDCTFHWRFDGTRGQLKKCKFYEIKDADSHTYIEVWPCEGKFRYSKSSDEQLLELESHIEGFKLYLYICKDMSPTAKSFLQAIDGLGGKSHLKVYVPRPPVMCPLRMSECTDKKGKFGLRRVFDREKSDLSGLFYRSHSFYPFFVTLWEHYHKAKFTIDPEPPKLDVNPKSRDLLGSKLSTAYEQRVVESHHQPEVASAGCEKLNLFKYYDCEPNEVLAANPKALQSKPHPLDSSYMKFDTPFFFMVTRESAFGRLVQCIGRFNNVAAVYTAKDVPPVSNV